MRLFRRLSTFAILTGVLALGAPGLAAADPGQGCTFVGPPGEFVPGQVISFVAQNVGHSAYNNPGRAKDPRPPFVPSPPFTDCNPTDNPQPPNPQF